MNTCKLTKWPTDDQGFYLQSPVFFACLKTQISQVKLSLVGVSLLFRLRIVLSHFLYSLDIRTIGPWEGAAYKSESRVCQSNITHVMLRHPPAGAFSGLVLPSAFWLLHGLLRKRDYHSPTSIFSGQVAQNKHICTYRLSTTSKKPLWTSCLFFILCISDNLVILIIDHTFKIQHTVRPINSVDIYIYFFFKWEEEKTVSYSTREPRSPSRSACLPACLPGAQATSAVRKSRCCRLSSFSRVGSKDSHSSRWSI